MLPAGSRRSRGSWQLDIRRSIDSSDDEGIRSWDGVEAGLMASTLQVQGRIDRSREDQATASAEWGSENAQNGRMAAGRATALIWQQRRAVRVAESWAWVRRALGVMSFSSTGAWATKGRSRTRG
jgi:hypothetical protein